MAPSPALDHYSVLKLPSPTSYNTPCISTSVIKAAYRAALLAHHPDKAPSSPTAERRQTKLSSQTALGARPTVDAITEAFRKLSDPSSRAAYDRSLLLARSTASAGTAAGSPLAHQSSDGLHILDLDELHHDEGTEAWWTACPRCRSERGIELSEIDLEAAAGDSSGQNGEVLVGCSGCSSWVSVTFQAEIDADEAGQEIRRNSDVAIGAT